jgi:EAL domain-containing protein (putative c-di-GMP-specific phosphodiesterase class I)
VEQIGQSVDAEVIVRTVIDLARSLNMRVTAEGVSTEAQRKYLVNHGCNELQGFLLSEPLPLEGLLAGGLDRAGTRGPRRPIARAKPGDRS